MLSPKGTMRQVSPMIGFGAGVGVGVGGGVGVGVGVGVDVDVGVGVGVGVGVDSRLQPARTIAEVIVNIASELRKRMRGS